MGIGCGKHYIIMTNRPKDPGLKVTYYIRKYLEERGAACIVCDMRVGNKSRHQLYEVASYIVSLHYHAPLTDADAFKADGCSLAHHTDDLVSADSNY